MPSEDPLGLLFVAAPSLFELLSELAPLVNAQLGVVYQTVEEEGQTWLRKLAAYAFSEHEGLAGPVWDTGLQPRSRTTPRAPTAPL